MVEPTTTYFNTYFLDNDGNLNEDALEEYCEYVDNCDNPYIDFYAASATNSLIGIVDTKIAECDSIEEYEEFVNTLLRHFMFKYMTRTYLEHGRIVQRLNTI